MSLRLPPEEYALVHRATLERDGFKCRYCGSRSQLHVHHVIYRSQGGPDELWNLLTLDETCHSAVHATDLILVEFGNQKIPFDTNYELLFQALNGWKPK